MLVEREPPDFVGQPLEPFLGVLHLVGRHGRQCSTDDAHVLNKLVERLTEQPVRSPLPLVGGTPAWGHAVWAPVA